MIWDGTLLQRLCQGLLQSLSGLVMVCILLSLANGQERSTWHIVKKLPTKPQKAFYVDRDPNSPEPESILSAPVLNAVFFTDDSNGWVVGDGGILVHTSNGGQTWTAKVIDLPANLHSVFFNNAHAGWVVGDYKRTGVILRTRDGGTNWYKQYQLEGFELSALNDIWFADEQHGWAVGEAQQNGTSQGIVFATQDGGAHWRLQYLSRGSSSGLRSVKFADAYHGWVVGDSLILHTENGGQQWSEQLAEPDKYFFGIDFINSFEGWVVGSRGLLLHTTNRGKKWERRLLPSEQQTLWLASVKFVSSTRGWIAGNDGTILSTNDGGMTWKLESTGMTEFLRGLALTHSNLFAV